MRAALLYIVLGLAASTLAAALPHDSSISARFAHAEAEHDKPLPEKPLPATPGHDKPLPEKPLPATPNHESGTSLSGSDHSYVEVHGDQPAGGHAPPGAWNLSPSAHNGEGSSNVQKVAKVITKGKEGKGH
jgi:hypothetical protein